jgi:hypothetical protein
MKGLAFGAILKARNGDRVVYWNNNGRRHHLPKRVLHACQSTAGLPPIVAARAALRGPASRFIYLNRQHQDKGVELGVDAAARNTSCLRQPSFGCRWLKTCRRAPPSTHQLARQEPRERRFPLPARFLKPGRATRRGTADVLDARHAGMTDDYTLVTRLWVVGGRVVTSIKFTGLANQDERHIFGDVLKRQVIEVRFTSKTDVVTFEVTAPRISSPRGGQRPDSAAAPKVAGRLEPRSNIPHREVCGFTPSSIRPR